MPDPLTNEWINLWKNEARDATSTARSGNAWSIGMRFRADDSGFLTDDREVVVRLDGDRVTDIAPGAAANADFTIAADARTWREVFDGKRDPATALMFGQLALERGSAMKLAPHVATARALLHSAHRVPTRKPENG